MHPIAIQLAFVAVAVVLVAVATLLRALWSEVAYLNRRLSTLADDLTELGKAKGCRWADHDAQR